MALRYLECQSSNANSITLTWHMRAERYKLEYKRPDEQWGKGTAYPGRGAPSVFVVEGLRPSSAYIFRLYCVNEDGQEGQPGQEVTFHTRDAPGCCTVA
eukprot:g9768.t1